MHPPVVLGSVTTRMMFEKVHVGGVKYSPGNVLKRWQALMSTVAKRRRSPADINRDTQIILAAVPPPCKSMVATVVRQTLDGDASLDPRRDITISMLGTMTTLLDGLAVMQSVVGLLPMNAIPLVRLAADNLVKHTTWLIPAHREVLKSIAPEVATAFSQATHVCSALRTMTSDFFVGLCDKVVRDFGLAEVEVPPFEPIPFSYDPPNTGVALYFTTSAQQGRYPRRYRHASTTEYKAATDMATKKEKCKKSFMTHRNRTGGVFRCVDQAVLCYC
jgi:hypothetical protein